MADCVVDADDILAALVDDRVDGNGGLAGLPIANDQFALPAANRDHRIDRLESGLQWLLDWIAIDDARRDAFDGLRQFRDDWPLAVNGLAERIDDAADQLRTHGHRNDAAGALDLVALFDFGEVAEQDGADAVLFEIQRDAVNSVRELQHLARHRLFDAVHARDPIADRYDRADFGDIDVDRVAPDLVPDDFGDFLSLDIHFYPGGFAPPVPPTRSLALLTRFDQCVFHFLQLRRDAAVEHRTPEACHDAADDRRIDFRRKKHLTPRGALETLLQLAQLLRRKRDRRSDLATEDLEMVHHPAAVRARHIGQQHQAIAFRQHHDQLRKRRADGARAIEQRPGHGNLLRRRDRRVSENVGERFVGGDEVRKLLHISLDRLNRGRRFLQRHVEEGARVTAGRSGARHAWVVPTCAA